MAQDVLQPEMPNVQQIRAWAKAVCCGFVHEEASMVGSAVRAHVAKSSPYNRFSFRGEPSTARIRKVRDHLLSNIFDWDPTDGICGTFFKLGQHCSRLLTSPEVTNVFHIVIAEAPGVPELHRAFSEAGPRFGTARFARYPRDLRPRLACDRGPGTLRPGDS